MLNGLTYTTTHHLPREHACSIPINPPIDGNGVWGNHVHTIDHKRSLSIKSVHGAFKAVFTLELVWPTSRVEPGLMCWCEQKNNQKNRPGSKILTLEIAEFNPGLTRVRPALSVVWTEIADYDPGYRKWETWPAAEIGLKGCFVSPALSLATS